MTIPTIKTGESVKVTVKISNETDGTTGDYVIKITIKDKDGTEYYLNKLLTGTLASYYFSTTAPTSPIKEYMATGTSNTFTYTALVPDCAEGTVQGKVEIYDEAGTEYIVGTEYTDVYKYEKKKFNLSLEVSWEKV